MSPRVSARPGRTEPVFLPRRDRHEAEAERMAARAAHVRPDRARDAVDGPGPAAPDGDQIPRARGEHQVPVDFDRLFGYDFADVRVLPDAAATAALGARAFTRGKRITVASAPDLGTSEGRALLAHELAHVVQQAREPAIAGTTQRDPAGTPPRIVRIVIFLKPRKVLISGSDGSRLVLKIAEGTSIAPGEYTGEHTEGSPGPDTMTPKGGKGGAVTIRVYFEEGQDATWAAYGTGTYPVVVYGLRAMDTAPADLGSGQDAAAGGGGADTGKKSEAGEPGGESGGKEAGKPGGTGTDPAAKPGGGGTGTADPEKDARAKKVAEKLKGLPNTGGPAITAEQLAKLAEMTEAEQADVLKFIKDAAAESDEPLDAKAELDKYLALSAAERELLRVNQHLATSKKATPIPAEVKLNIDTSAQKTSEGLAKATGELNKQLGELGRIHAKVTHDTLVDQEGSSLEPIELEKLPVFREMMMLEGLLAGASTKSASIETAAKDLTKSIAGIRDYVLEEIAWLAVELGAGYIIGALTGPIGTGAAVVRGAMLLRRLNKLRVFLTKVEQVYSTYSLISQIISRVTAAYATYKAFQSTFGGLLADLETLREQADDPNLDETATEAAVAKLTEFEDQLTEKVLAQLESGEGMGALLEYFDIPAESTEEDLRQILYNIPVGLAELQALKQRYDSSGRDLESVKLLAYKGVLVGALLYPFVGYLARSVGSKISALMAEKDLGDRLLEIISRSSAGKKHYTAPGATASRKRLAKAKRPPRPAKPAKTKDKDKGTPDPAKAKKKGKGTEAEEPGKTKKKDADDPTKKKTDDDTDPAKKKTEPDDPKKKPADPGDLEWAEVVRKVAALPARNQPDGATRSALRTQGNQIRTRHKTVARSVSVQPVSGRGEWHIEVRPKTPKPTRAEAKVLMGYRERWEAGQAAIEKVVAGLDANSRSKASITSAIEPIKTAYSYSALDVVNHKTPHRTGHTITGRMGSMPARDIADVDDLSGLHTGEKTDPIPIHWYKNPSWYPGHTKPLKLTIGGTPTDFSMTSTPTPVTLAGGTVVTIGVDAANIVSEGSVIKRNSKHTRDTTQTDALKAALKAAGYSAWSDKDIDHVTDLAFEGTNKFSNLWPLNRDKNRHAFSGMWYRNYGIQYLDRTKPNVLKTGTLYTLQGKWFKVLKGYETRPRVLGGRTTTP